MPSNVVEENVHGLDGRTADEPQRCLVEVDAPLQGRVIRAWSEGRNHRRGLCPSHLCSRLAFDLMIKLRRQLTTQPSGSSYAGIVTSEVLVERLPEAATGGGKVASMQ